MTLDVLSSSMSTFAEGVYAVAEPIAQSLGMNPLSLIFLVGFSGLVILPSIASRIEKRFEVKTGISLGSGIAVVTFFTIDYLVYSGKQATGYFSSKVVALSDSMTFLIFLLIMGTLITIDLVWKKDFLKDKLGLDI